MVQPLAQTGLGSPAGGFFVLLLAGALGLIGLGMSVAGVVLLVRGGPSFWRIFLLVGGVASLSPALLLTFAFAFGLLDEYLPRTESWDFSASRSVSGLDLKRRRPVERSDHDAQYSFQGNIRSTVRLPADRQLSGTAYLVIVEAMGDQITAIDWQGRRGATDQVFQQAKRILHELKLTDHDLDSWYAKVRGGETRWFTVESQTEPRIRLDIRRIPGGGEGTPLEKREWYVNVYVDWKTPAG